MILPGGILRQENMLSQDNLNNEVFTTHTSTEPLLCFQAPHGTLSVNTSYVEKNLLFMRGTEAPARADTGESGLLCDLPKY